MGWVKLTHFQCAEERGGRQWGSQGESDQEKGRCDYEKKRLKGEELYRSEGRRIHSQSQLSSPELWDTVKEIVEKRKKGRKKQRKIT